MKKLIFGALLSTLFVLFSCSEDSTTEPETTTGGTMSATVNGNAWNSITGAAIANVLDVDFDGESQKALQIIGTSTNFSSFTINLPITELSLGSQTFTGDSANGILSYFNGSSNLYTSEHTNGEFTINITTLNLADGKMSGTFSGKLYDDTDVLLNITNGAFNNISIFSTSFYSIGTMSLKRNSGQVFTMDASNADGKSIMIIQSNANNSISITGNNTTLTNDFGIYDINFPIDVATGTYTLTNNGMYSAGLGNSDSEPEYTITGGSLTITSHNGNNVAGTFNYTANNGVQTVTISNGNFSITHK